MDLFKGNKNIYLAILAVVIIIAIIYYYKYSRKTTNAIKLKVATRFDGETVQVEPVPQPLSTDASGETKVSRVVYQSGVGSYVDDFKWKDIDVKLAVKPIVNLNKTEIGTDGKSLRASAFDTRAKPLYDYNPTTYAMIIPCVQDRNLFINNQCLNANSDLFKQFYMQNNNIYSRMLFAGFTDVTSRQEQNEVGVVAVKQVPVPVQKINSIYLLFTTSRSFSSTGKYLLKYGKYDTTNKTVNTITTTPLSFEIKDGQDEVLIDIPPVTVYDPVTDKYEILFVEIRRLIDNVNGDLKVYLSEILFNFKEDFSGSRNELIKRENVDTSSIVSVGLKSREQEEIDNEENFCLSRGMQYLWTGDIDSSKCVKPCSADVDCSGDVFMEKEDNSYMFVKLENATCSGVGNNRKAQPIKYCTGVISKDAEGKVKTYSI